MPPSPPSGASGVSGDLSGSGEDELVRGICDREEEVTDRRISADIHSNTRDDMTVIELPLKVGKIKTVVTIVMEESGKVHVAAPMNEPHLTMSLLNRARKVVEDHQANRLIQPVNGILGHV